MVLEMHHQRDWNALFRVSLRNAIYGDILGYGVLNAYLNRKKRDRISGANLFMDVTWSFGGLGDSLNMGLFSGKADGAVGSLHKSILSKIYDKAAEKMRDNREILKKFDDCPEALFLLGVSYKGEDSSKAEKYVRKALKKGLADSEFLIDAYGIGNLL